MHKNEETASQVINSESMNQQLISLLNANLEARSDRPEFAVAVCGDWGIGKTYFVRKFLQNRGTEVSYFSLFGMKDVQDIARKIFELENPFLSSPAAKLTLGALSNVAKLDPTANDKLNRWIGALVDSVVDRADSLVNHSKRLSQYSGNGLVPESLLHKPLVIDDLERCTIEPELIFGVLSDLLQIQGYPVILIYNKDRLEAKFNDSKVDLGYLKEKVVGSEMAFCPDVKTILGLLYRPITCEGNGRKEKNSSEKEFKDINSLIVEDVDFYTSVLARTGNNIRRFRQIVWDFRQALGLASDDVKKVVEDNKANCLKVYVALALEIEKRTGNPQEIDQAEAEGNSGNVKNTTSVAAYSAFLENRSDQTDNIYTAYGLKKDFEILFPARQWVNIVSKRDFNQVNIATIYWRKDKTAYRPNNWMRLWEFPYVDEHEYQSALSGVLDELGIGYSKDVDEGRINQVNILVLLQELGIFSEMEKMGYISQKEGRHARCMILKSLRTKYRSVPAEFECLRDIEMRLSPVVVLNYGLRGEQQVLRVIQYYLNKMDEKVRAAVEAKLQTGPMSYEYLVNTFLTSDPGFIYAYFRDHHQRIYDFLLGPGKTREKFLLIQELIGVLSRYSPPKEEAELFDWRSELSHWVDQMEIPSDAGYQRGSRQVLQGQIRKLLGRDKPSAASADV